MKNSDLNYDMRGKTRQQIFYLLFDFAQRICVRYTDIEKDFRSSVYDGFASFFNYGHYRSCSNSVSLKAHLKNVLITQCIEKERWTSQFAISNEEFFPDENLSPENDFQHLSEKEFIDILRGVPFPLRAVYNMVVIDRLNYAEISEILNIQEDLIQPYLNLCRHHLRKAVTDNIKRKKNTLSNNDINYVEDERLWQE